MKRPNQEKIDSKVHSVRCVIDTNVFASALRSSEGASYLLLSVLEDMPWRICLTPTLFLEYEEQIKKDQVYSELPMNTLEDFLDIFASRSEHVRIFYQWRPQLKKPDHDMILEAAVNGSCTHIITFNTRDFHGVGRFGITVCTPKEFLITENIIQGDIK